MSTTDDLQTTEYRCVQCPLGCRLEVDAIEDEVLEVRGHGCRRGITYGTQEHLDPRRDVSTTITLVGGAIARLPVRAAEPIRKADVEVFVRAVQRHRAVAPVAFGEVVLADVAGTGIDAIATRAMPRRPAVGDHRPRQARPLGPAGGTVAGPS